jgi:hypothetical protein
MGLWYCLLWILCCRLNQHFGWPVQNSNGVLTVCIDDSYDSTPQALSAKLLEMVPKRISRPCITYYQYDRTTKVCHLASSKDRWSTLLVWAHGYLLKTSKLLFFNLDSLYVIHRSATSLIASRFYSDFHSTSSFPGFCLKLHRALWKSKLPSFLDCTLYSWNACLPL